LFYVLYFFFQAEDGIRDRNVTGVQTCALPISLADIAAAYGCQSAVRGNTAENTERTIILVGTVNALEALRLLLPSISNQMEASAKFMSSSHISDIRELRNYTRSELETERTRYYRSFVRAYGQAVAERIREFRARMQQMSEQQ